MSLGRQRNDQHHQQHKHDIDQRRRVDFGHRLAFAAIASVPVPVIGPPVRPAPLATFVTVPPELVSLSTPSANPAGTPLRPDHGAALLIVQEGKYWHGVAARAQEQIDVGGFQARPEVDETGDIGGGIADAVGLFRARMAGDPAGA